MSAGSFFGQLVVGPAGSGKSTYCASIQEQAELLRRNVIVVNLDPAAEVFKYKCDIDIRDLISLQDVMEEVTLGPNGGLIYCMEYIIENKDWLQDQLSDLANDDYVLFDCPGQIELYTHLNLMNSLSKMLLEIGFNLCSVYMLDTTFILDNQKFVSGVLMALCSMVNLNLPHLTILTKCDLVENKDYIDKYLNYADDIEDIDVIDNDVDSDLEFDSIKPTANKKNGIQQQQQKLNLKDGNVGLKKEDKSKQQQKIETSTVAQDQEQQQHQSLATKTQLIQCSSLQSQILQNKLIQQKERAETEIEQQKTDILQSQNKEEIQIKTEISQEKEVQKLAQSKDKKTNFQKKYQKLCIALKELVDEFKLVSLLPLDLDDKDSITSIIMEADQLLQYDEIKEPDEKLYNKIEEQMNEDQVE